MVDDEVGHRVAARGPALGPDDDRVQLPVGIGELEGVAQVEPALLEPDTGRKDPHLAVFFLELEETYGVIGVLQVQDQFLLGDLSF